MTIPGEEFSPADSADGMSYDRVLGRWVPVSAQAITPNGLRYVYAEHTGTASTFHVFDLRTNTDRALKPPAQWVGAGLDNDAIYAMRVDLVTSAAYGTLEISRGLWSIPLDGSTGMQLAANSRRWVWVSAGGAYGDINTNDVAGPPNDVSRLDLASGKAVVWFDHQVRSRIVAVDEQGAAFVLTDSGDEELWRVSAPNVAVEIWSGPTNAIRPDSPVAVYGTEVWFSSSSATPDWAIFHYSPAGGFTQVATFSERPVTVAGTCE